MDRQTIDWYDRNAEEVARRYESVPGGISDFFRLVFAPGDSVLEIGSGSGRDAARLLELGVHVHAVEPSAGLRHRAAVLHPELSGRLFEGELPADLPPPVAGPYDGVVLSAIIMHIPVGKAASFKLRRGHRIHGRHERRGAVGAVAMASTSL